MRGSRRRKSIYHWRKQEKATDANIMQLLMPSVFGIIICLVCLAGMTWAWFTDTGEVSAAPLRSAQHKVQVEIKDAANGTEVQSGGDGEYTLTKDALYNVTLTVVESTSYGGFSAVSVDGDTYYTERMQKNNNNSITFTVCSSEGKIIVASGWESVTNGTELPQPQDKYIGRGETSTKEDEGNSNDAAQSNNADKSADREKIYIEPSVEDSNTASQDEPKHESKQDEPATSPEPATEPTEQQGTKVSDNDSDNESQAPSNNNTDSNAGENVRDTQNTQNDTNQAEE